MKRRQQSARIYYSEPGMPPLYWRVKVTDAKKSVKLNGTLADALAGVPGVTIGCHLSNCASRNKSVFDHPVIIASFTRGVCLIVDKVKDGRPVHAVRYYHKYANLVDLNDTDKTKEIIRSRPELSECTFLLQKPWKSTTHGGPGAHDHGHGKKRNRLPSGSLGRAVRAGLISKPVAEALSR